MLLTSMVLRILAKEPMPSRILRTRAAFWMVCSASLLSLAAFARIISSSVSSASAGYTTHINKLSLCDNVGWLLELAEVFWHSYWCSAFIHLGGTMLYEQVWSGSKVAQIINLCCTWRLLVGYTLCPGERACLTENLKEPAAFLTLLCSSSKEDSTPVLQAKANYFTGKYFVSCYYEYQVDVYGLLFCRRWPGITYIVISSGVQPKYYLIKQTPGQRSRCTDQGVSAMVQAVSRRLLILAAWA